MQKEKKYIIEMFDSIARRYDILNHILSMGLDCYWRKKMIKRLKHHLNLTDANESTAILDVATGTGDLAMLAAQKTPAQIIGVDISQNMLDSGNKKIKKKGMHERIQLQQGDGEQLLFPDCVFDAVIIAFGIRNFERPDKGLREMIRVIKPGGCLMIMEFSLIKPVFLKKIFNFYFKWILPLIGKMISKDKSAYQYLPDSVNEFARQFNLLERMEQNKLIHCKKTLLSFGIVSIFEGQKQE
jgi:demethylmenaquinone methyltransferase/2-methoxy-6-polyprenyl-1,4-benzoquinol methylase